MFLLNINIVPSPGESQTLTFVNQLYNNSQISLQPSMKFLYQNEMIDIK